LAGECALHLALPKLLRNKIANDRGFVSGSGPNRCIPSVSLRVQKHKAAVIMTRLTFGGALPIWR
jgi:hypothetical protein